MASDKGITRTSAGVLAYQDELPGSMVVIRNVSYSSLMAFIGHPVANGWIVLIEIILGWLLMALLIVLWAEK